AGCFRKGGNGGEVAGCDFIVIIPVIRNHILTPRRDRYYFCIFCVKKLRFLIQYYPHSAGK
ncbi:hypothetical protein, partial [Fischerella thermalis]|uniref:hypothetical protein n=1 Tax=Fischerella thermalis TaxID=372787 RepID=UPI001CA5C32E